MNYQKIYDSIIAKAKSENRVKGKDTYYEAHHIIPKCLDGEGLTKQWKTHPNIILLTGREHFLCHRLLHEIYPNNSKIFYAFSMMFLNNANQSRYIPNARSYEYLRIQSKKFFSQKGEKNHMWGKTGKNHMRSKKVIQYTKDKIFIKMWDGISEASRELNIPRASISYACIGKLKTAGKFIWEFST
jgi:hypothetical protein